MSRANAFAYKDIFYLLLLSRRVRFLRGLFLPVYGAEEGEDALTLLALARPH